MTEVAKELRQLGFDPVRVMRGSAGGADQATRANILAALETLVAPLGANDLIVVMLSGHGQQFRFKEADPDKPGQEREREDAFFCPVDAVNLDPRKLVSLSHITDTILANNVGKRLVLVDACRDEPKDPNKGAKGIQGRQVALTEDTGVFFSCKAGQQSFVNNELQHSLFSYCVLEALRGKGADEGEVTWAGLVSHVTRRMASREMLERVPMSKKQTPIPAGSVEHTVLGRLSKESKKQRPTLLVAPFDQQAARAKQEEWARFLDRPSVVEKNSLGIPMVLIPPGEFLMGSAETAEQLLEFARRTGFADAKLEYFADEGPQHRVRLTRPFFVSQREVTKGDFSKFVSATGYLTEAERDGKGGGGYDPKTGKFEQLERYNWKSVGWSPYEDNHPVVNVTWNDVHKYVEWLNGTVAGGGYRLLTEAEWEYCARAGTTTRYPTGDDPETLVRIANVADGTAKAKFSSWATIAAKDGHVFTAPTGTYAANNFGLHDMIGNVFEWCEDAYDAKYYGQFGGQTAIDPVGPASVGGSQRVNRGGGWNGNAVDCRSAGRGWDSPGVRLNFLGFRLALSSVSK